MQEAVIASPFDTKGREPMKPTLLSGLSANLLITNFDVFAEASGGTTRLRELATELAVRGHLLDRAATSSWQQVTLGEVVADFQNGISKRRGDSGTPTPVLRLADIEAGVRLREQNLREIVLTLEEQQKYAVEEGDVLVIRVNGSADLVGCFVPCVTKRTWAYSDHLIRLRLRSDLITPAFLCTVSRSAAARVHLVAKTVTTAGQKTINQGGLGTLPLLLPPLDEQKRIVARVDQLMVLIDELNARLTTRREASARFSRASLRALTTNDELAESNAAWKRVLDNLPTIVDRWEKVGELRSAVLDLAVQGRLVQQDEGEGTAQALVEQCPIRQREEETSGRFKPAKRVVQPLNTNMGWLPASWRHECLGNLCRFIDYRGKTPEKLPTGVRLITAKNVRMGFIKKEPEEFIGPADYTRWMTRGLPVPGDLLFTTEAPLGNVALFEFSDPVALAQRIIALHPYCDMEARFLMFVLMSPWFQATLAKKATGMTATGIKASKLKELAVPLAPPGEQRRIVAKVQRLMELCDDLEAKLRRAEDRASKLVEAVVQELVV